MSEFKGTKGKWRFDDLELVIKSCDDSNPKFQTIIAHVNSKFNYSPGKQTQFYNALLIAASPELLEGIRVLVERMEENGLGNFPSVVKYRQLYKQLTL